MKPLKLSQAEKGLIRSALIFLFVQALFIIVFVYTVRPISAMDLKEAQITVDHTFYIHSDLSVDEGSDRYVFKPEPPQPHPRKLNKMIHVGEKLSIRYYEVHRLFYTENIIVDARSETEVYRCIDDRGRISRPVAIVIFSILELGSIGIVWLDISLKKNVIKDFRRKLKRWRCSK